MAELVVRACVTVSWARMCGWGWAGNHLFLILQISESFSSSVGAHAVNPSIICDLLLASLAPFHPNSGQASLSLATTFSFSHFAVVFLLFPFSF